MYTGITLAVRQSSGTSPVSRDFRKIRISLQKPVSRYLRSPLRLEGIRRRNKTDAKAKKTGGSKRRSKFETLRREIKADIKKQHDQYVNNVVGDIKANPRDFCRYIHSQQKDTQCISPLKRRNGNGVALSELEQTDKFNGQFTDAFNKNEHSQVRLQNRLAPFMSDMFVST